VWFCGILILATLLPAQTIQTSVAADDGVQLATDVYLPLGVGPWPTILVRTPYGRSGDPVGLVFALLGYACVIQDTRGRFGSDGIDTVFRDDGDDGRATIRWVLDQWWCDGRVGTFGGSAVGITQHMLMPDAGSGLRCTAPVVATPDLYHHAFLQGGALREALVFNWLDGQDSIEFVDQVKAHRLFDEWWRVKDVVPRSHEVTAAGLHIGGWYDIFGQGTVSGFETLQYSGGVGAAGRQVLVMGPWTHEFDVLAGELVYPADSLVDAFELLIPWYEHHLKGVDNGVDEWPAAYVFQMGAVGEDGAPGNRWRALDRWPPETVPLELFLSADRRLSPAAGAASELALVSDPVNPVPTLGGANLFPDLEVDGRPMGAGPFDQRPIEVRDDVLVFSTETLAHPVSVMGRISATIWVRPDTEDLDLAVRLCDVYPDGRSMLVTDGIQRARMRCGDEQECLLVPGQPAEITVDLWSTALVFNAGHRIRISVSGSNFPRFEVNPNHGGDLDGGEPAVVARPDLLFGADHPSRLVVPIEPAPREPEGRGR
jgi:predicted acyl esterase